VINFNLFLGGVKSNDPRERDKDAMDSDFAISKLYVRQKQKQDNWFR